MQIANTFGGSTERELASFAPRPVSIELLQRGNTVRLGGLDECHLGLIARLGGAWPPIVVTPTWRIVDGHYRYAAARRLGHTHVACIVFDGDDFDAFLESVRLNIMQGLPLALQERKAAARRILDIHPEWSDRRVAELCGLAHKTVGRLREDQACQGGDIHHLDTRQGRDGKVWVGNAVQVRERIVEAIHARPEASLREIARAAGTTHETVRTFRRRVQATAEAAEERAIAPSKASTDKTAVVPSRDAAFTSTDAGASFARWFERSGNEEWRTYVASVPLSRVYEIEDEARRRAHAWSEFAAMLSARAAGQWG